eukprot:COSAG06_NODE_824_length_12073_cov_102.305161_4_plen_145_part_00
MVVVSHQEMVRRGLFPPHRQIEGDAPLLSQGPCIHPSQTNPDIISLRLSCPKLVLAKQTGQFTLTKPPSPLTGPGSVRFAPGVYREVRLRPALVEERRHLRRKDRPILCALNDKHPEVRAAVVNMQACPKGDDATIEVFIVAVS